MRVVVTTRLISIHEVEQPEQTQATRSGRLVWASISAPGTDRSVPSNPAATLDRFIVSRWLQSPPRGQDSMDKSHVGGPSFCAVCNEHKEAQLELSTCIAELLKAPSLSAMAVAAHSLQPPSATSAEAKSLYERLPGHIAANDRRIAVASTLALLCLDGRAWLARMRKDGVFRASRYGYNNGCLKKVVGTALELASLASLPPEQVQYLNSVLALLELARPARQIHRSILARLKARDDRALKTLLALVNASFSINWRGSDQADPNLPLRWSATDLASAFSRLTFAINFKTPRVR